MRRVSSFIFAILCWSVCCAAGPATAPQSREPYYRGKSLTQWTHALKEPNAAIRQRAAAAIGQMDLRARASASQLAELMQHDPQVAVRQESARTLLALSSAARRQIPALVAALHDPDPDVRATACRALGSMGEDAASAAPALAEELHDNSPLCATDAANALAKIGEGGDAALVAGASSTSTAYVRWFALEGLLGRKQASPQDIKALQGALSDPAWQTRMAAAEVLERFGAAASPASVDLARCLSDSSIDLRVSAARALASIGPPAKPALAALRLAIKSPATAPTTGKSHLLRVSLARAIWLIAGDKAATTPVFLWEASGDDPPARARAIQCLADVRDTTPAALQCIAAGLSAAQADVRLASIRALGLIGPPARDYVIPLRELMKSKQSELVMIVVESLWKVDQNYAEIAPTLSALLEDDDWTVRDGASALAGELGVTARSLVPHLIPRLTDENAYVRISAAMSLWHITSDPDESLKVLSRIAGDIDATDSYARVMALQALGAMGPAARQAAPMLGQLLNDDFASVRGAARAAADKISGASSNARS